MEGRTLVVLLPDKMKKPVLEQYSPSDDNATISWKNCDCEKYFVRWWIDGKEPYEVEWPVPAFTINDLKPGLRYNVQVAACVVKDNEEKHGQYSELLTFYSGLKSPTDLQVLPGKKSPDTSFIAMFNAQQTQDITHEITYRSLTTGMIDKVNAEFGFANIEGLTPGDTYDIWVVAIKDGVESKPCKLDKPIQTYPAKVDGLGTSKSSSTSQTVRWNPVFGASSYLVKKKRCDGNHETIPTTDTEITLSHLERGQEYRVCVAAVNTAGTSEFSDPETFTTELSPPTNIQTKVIYIGDDASLEVKFNRSDENIEKHIVTAKEESGDPQPKETQSSQIIFTKLNNGSCYTVCVHAVSVNGVESKNVYVEPVWICPALVTELRSQPATGNLERVSWEAVPGAESYQVNVEESGDIKEYGTKEPEITVTNLNLNKRHDVKVRAVNAAGSGRWSKPVSFMTALFPPEDIKISNMMYYPESRILVTWKGCEGALTYRIELVEVATNKTVEAKSTQKCYYEFYNLQSSCEYRASITCISDNKDRNSSLAHSEAIWTYCPKVNGLEATYVSSKTTKLKWEPVPSASEYKIRYKAFDSNYKQIEVKGSEHTISDLELGKQYIACVSAINAAGEGKESESVEFRTGMEPPQILEVSKHSENPTTALLLNFIEPNNKPSYYAAIAIAVSGQHRSEIQKTDVSFCTIPDLEPGVQYVVQAWSVCKEDERLNSENISSQKIWTCPPKILDVKAQKDTDRSQNITWGEVMGATSYKVQVKKRGNSPTIEFTDTHHIHLKHLELNSKYAVSVSAANPGGYGKESDEVTFETALHPVKRVTLEKSKCNPTTELVARIEESEALSTRKYKLRFINLNGGPDKEITTHGNIVRMDELQQGTKYRVGVTSLHETDRELSSEEILSDPIWTSTPGLKLETQKISHNEQKLTWNDIIDVSEYEVHWRIEHGDWQQKIMSRNEFILKHLEPGKNYEVYVIAVNDGGAGEKSNTIQFSTVPVVPTNLKYQILSTQEVKLLCEPCEGATGYTFIINNKRYESEKPEYTLQCYDQIGFTVTVESHNDAGKSKPSEALNFRQVLIYLQRKFKRVAQNILKNIFVIPKLVQVPNGDTIEDLESFATDIQEGATNLLIGQQFAGKTACCSYFFQHMPKPKLAFFLDYEAFKNLPKKFNVKSLLHEYMLELSEKEMDIVLQWMKDNSDQVVFVVDNFIVSQEFKPQQFLYADERPPNQIFYNLLRTNRQLFPKSQVFCSTLVDTVNQFLKPTMTLKINGFDNSGIQAMKENILEKTDETELSDVLQYFSTNPGFCESVLHMIKNNKTGFDYTSYASVMIQILLENINRYPPQQQKVKVNLIMEKINGVPKRIEAAKISPQKIKKSNSQPQATSVRKSSIHSGGMSFMEYEDDNFVNGKAITNCDTLQDSMTVAFYFAFFCNAEDFRKRIEKKSIKFGSYAKIWIMAAGLLREETMKSSKKIFELAGKEVDESMVQEKCDFVKEYFKKNIERILEQIYNEPQITLDWFSVCKELNDDELVNMCKTKIRIISKTTTDEVDKVAEFLRRLPKKFCPNVKVKYKGADLTNTMSIDRAMRENPHGELILMKGEDRTRSIMNLDHSTLSRYHSFRERERSRFLTSFMNNDAHPEILNGISIDKEDFIRQEYPETSLLVNIPLKSQDDTKLKCTAKSLATGVTYVANTWNKGAIISEISPGEEYVVQVLAVSSDAESLLNESLIQTYKTIGQSGEKLEVGCCSLTFPAYKLETNIKIGIALCKNILDSSDTYVDIAPIFYVDCSVKMLHNPAELEVGSYCSTDMSDTEVYVFRLYKSKWVMEGRTSLTNDRTIVFKCSQFGAIRLAVKSAVGLKFHFYSSLFYDSVNHNLIHIFCFEDDFNRENMKNNMDDSILITPFSFRHISITNQSSLNLVLSEKENDEIKKIGKDSIDCASIVSKLNMKESIFPVDISKIHDDKVTVLEFRILDGNKALVIEEFNFNFNKILKSKPSIIKTA